PRRFLALAFFLGLGLGLLLGAGLLLLLGVLLLALVLGIFARREALLESLDRLGDRVLVGQAAFVLDVVEQLAVAAAELLEELGLETADVAGRDVVDEPARPGEDGDHLLLYGHRRPQRLLEQFGEAVAAVELGLADLVELGAEA